jgi:hypothetical protein
MEVFRCPACAAAAPFRAPACGCGAALVWSPDARGFAADAAPCANRDAACCNWAAEGAGGLCRACAMTRTVPDLDIGDNRALWREAELAKRWALANLMRWGWFSPGSPFAPPTFDLLGEAAADGPAQVTMGHAEGVVTINVAEADPAVREARRAELGERYRTMTGHFRHELGHFLFVRLATLDGFLAAFRERFGDERADYAGALDRHYAEGPPPDWAARHLSPYASAHPHEDWAETAAHLLHLTDIADSAIAAGLSVPSLAAAPAGFDPWSATDPEPGLTIAMDVALAANAVNRAMGLPDLYPFVVGPVARAKLGFARDWLRRGGG